MILFYCALRARQLPIKFDGSDRTNVIQQIDHNFPLSRVKPSGFTIELFSEFFSPLFVPLVFLILFQSESFRKPNRQCKENDIAGFFLPKHHSKMRDIEEAL